MSNGFRIYSQGGAQWDTTTAVIHSSVSSYFDLVNAVVERNTDGITDDTIGFGHSIMYGPGIPNGFEDTAWTISIGPIDASYVGREICLDSCWYPPTGTWLWATTRYVPTWDGPHCWEVSNPVVQVSGRLYFEDPVPPGLDTVPASNYYVSLWDRDTSGSDEALSYGFIRTNDSGYFSFPPWSNDDSDDGGTVDAWIVVRADNGIALMKDDAAGSVHQWWSPPYWDVPSGTVTLDWVIPEDSASPFFVGNAMLKSFREWEAQRPDKPLDSQLTVVVHKCDTGAYYHFGYDFIHINDSDFTGPNSWTEMTLHHEFGHRIADAFSFADSITSDTTYYMMDSVNPCAAMLEGFAWWWSAVAMDTSMLVRYYANFSDSEWVDWENGLWGHKDTALGCFNAMSSHCIGASAGILWDILDSHDDDYSDRTGWMSTDTADHNLQDGIGDTLSAGSASILDVLLDRQVSGRGPITMQEFFDRWFEQPSLLHPQAMLDIWYEHGEELDCCTGIPGDVDGNGNYYPDVADLVYLVSYMFSGGAEPSCLKESNIDGAGYDHPDISDLVYLVSYVFSYGPEPPSCNSFKTGRVDKARVTAR